VSDSQLQPVAWGYVELCEGAVGGLQDLAAEDQALLVDSTACGN
jgi:hypothetical protein